MSLTISSYGYWNMIRFSTLAAIMKRVTMGVLNRGLICAKSSQNTATVVSEFLESKILHEDHHFLSSFINS